MNNRFTIILCVLLALLVAAVIWILVGSSCGGHGSSHASNRGNNCCCCSGSGSGQSGSSGGMSASAWGSFGQPTTYITTSSLTEAPNGKVTFTMDPARHPTGGGYSYPQTVSFTVVGAITSVFSPRVRIWRVDATTDVRIEPPIYTFPGGVYTIEGSTETRKYEIEVYKKLSPGPVTYFDTRSNYYTDAEPGEVQVTYTCPEGTALLSIDD